MSPDVVRLILQFAGIATGATGGQVIIFLLKRRSELRVLDSKSESTALDSANAYIKTLQNGDLSTRAEVEKLKDEMRAERKACDDRMAALTEALESADREHTRTRAELARVRSDLGTAQSQIEELSRISGHPRHGRLDI